MRGETGDWPSHPAWDEIESWTSQDLLKTCASTEPVSGPDNCQIGMTSMVLGTSRSAHAPLAYRIATRLLATQFVASWDDIERHLGPERALILRGRDVLSRDVLPNALTWPSTAAPVDWAMLASSIRVCFASGGTLISGLIRCVLPARPCGADLENRQSIFHTLWRVHRSWSSPSRPSSEHQCLTKLCCIQRCQFGFTVSPNLLPFVSLSVASSRSQAAYMVRRGNF